MKKFNLSNIIIVILLVVIAFLSLCSRGTPEKPKVIYKKGKTDTVIVHKIITVPGIPEYIVKRKTDTVFIKDETGGEVETVSHQWTDTISRDDGFRLVLRDSMNTKNYELTREIVDLYYPLTEKTVTRTDTLFMWPPKQKYKPFSMGIQAGFGTGGPYLGVGVQFNLIRF